MLKRVVFGSYSYLYLGGGNAVAAPNKERATKTLENLRCVYSKIEKSSKRENKWELYDINI
jgi:hypothetical protein